MDRRWQAGTQITAPLRLLRVTVSPDWVDYNRHLSEWAYLLLFGDNSDAFFRFAGIDEAYRASGQSLYTVETHMRNLHEVSLGAQLSMSLQVLGLDSKRLHIVHEMTSAAGELVATAEQMLLHVDTRAGRAAPFPAETRHRLERIRAAHAVLAVPGYIGHVMRIPGG